MKIGRASTFSVVGVHGFPVLVEVALLQGLPAFTIVGLPDTAVCESRERIRSAFAAAGIAFPQARVTVNLSPADTPKSGTSFDLAIATGILSALSGKPTGGGIAHVGELGLDGSVRPVRGVLPVALSARRAGLRKILVPSNQGNEAHMADIDVEEIWHIAQIAEKFGVECAEAPPAPRPPSMAERREAPHLDMADVRGQSEAKLALEVAAAGGHHAFMVGPPGVGKSMLALRMPGIMPPLTREQAIEVASIQSCLGEFDGHLATRAPWANPHHSSSIAALVGGGSIPRPGAISRAHHGILFLDELPEFSSAAIQALRQPMEAGVVDVYRARAAITFPAQFQLIGAANPCKCGRGFEPASACTCSARERRDYFRRIGGPILDRFDVSITVRQLTPAQAALSGDGEPSHVIAERVREARARAARRFSDEPWEVNARASSTWLRRHTVIPAAIGRRFDSLLTRGTLSMRGLDKILRLSWTYADLAGRDRPDTDEFHSAFMLRHERQVAI
ncbi:YifB family Mg chelatase-like AAA ATPase [Arcanobacterium haemolyticum]|nr:YifB family Mg chelatase-like AAA ATPase [Arcanobacterium haemolyticum]